VALVLDLGAHHDRTLLLMQGFALQPGTYRATARLLAEHCRVLVPPLFAERGAGWTPERALATVRRALDDRGITEVTMLGHSFGGALGLELAVDEPGLVSELVFVDTLAMSRAWALAVEAVHPVHLLWMATPQAAIDFGRSVFSHPLCLARAGWWGFHSDRREYVSAARAAGIPAHVLWAERDSLLTREDGQAFAVDLGADFVVVHGTDRTPVDHDWLYRHPHLALRELQRLDLDVLGRIDATTAPGVVLRSADCAGPAD
jgi:pimeloyl-ACP methyl ester carboxylesterase